MSDGSSPTLSEVSPWRVMVPEGAGPWPDHSSPPLDAQVWVEAWDDLVPGYRRRRFTSAEEADAAFRMLRGRGYSVMIEECAGE